MREQGLLDDPNQPKKMSWTTFIKSHLQSVAACNFFTVEAWTPHGLTRYLVFFVTKRVQIAGIHHTPDKQWMIQQARNLTDSDQGFLTGKYTSYTPGWPFDRPARFQLFEVGKYAKTCVYGIRIMPCLSM